MAAQSLADRRRAAALALETTLEPGRDGLPERDERSMRRVELVLATISIVVVALLAVWHP